MIRHPQMSGLRHSDRSADAAWQGSRESEESTIFDTRLALPKFGH